MEKGRIHHRIRILHLILAVSLVERHLTKTLLLLLLRMMMRVIIVVIIVFFNATLVHVHLVRLMLHQGFVLAVRKRLL